MATVYKALTIAGSDSGGGAGIQADLKTFQELGVYGMTAITAVTAQNTLGVQGIYPLPVEGIIQQIESVGSDLGADAVKTGMLFNREIIQGVAEQVKKFRWKNLVVDPVMIAKGGASLLQEEAVEALRRDLIPLAKIVTPNIPEAEVLTGMSIRTMDDRKEVAKKIVLWGAKSVVIKGGHEEGEKVLDLIYDGTQFTQLEYQRVDTRHTHGTGCTFSAAITAQLAKGENINNAVKKAKEFIHAAIEDGLGIGGGHGPTNHWAYRKKRDEY
ncbi:bifunctional hydroxymethylpyrimidine kinase/phosphomethylpyrimidine kinase [Microaerobacter geothermalis]|uniref:bifunctional hydroxymethylpyrimidine kinase/phosphomethylpyrimidine kinase n=1 Tax=Microaerobacter geothermalis TaxID=674972 RepID=UPI001F178354|nr:bifunctional hydroxymethylpyrimidine kinase/phosphomethylpyrimidine kinase [Microaerobacter geothermalis]MCF6092595.1 bifunctional hydroxymethylpyrimidine kinase/phosphomethylpyrimidine kinase [Microaerobacter geothermalis]